MYQAFVFENMQIFLKSTILIFLTLHSSDKAVFGTSFSLFFGILITWLASLNLEASLKI